MDKFELSESDNLLINIISEINQKNVLLAYQQDAYMPDLLYGLISEILNNTSMTPLVWICWNEPASVAFKKLQQFNCKLNKVYFLDTVSNITEDNKTILFTQKNFSGMMISIKKNVKNKEPLIVFDNLNFLEDISSIKSFVKFISTLIRNCTGCTIISSIRLDILETSFNRELLSLFDLEFHINNDNMKITGDAGSRYIFYEVKNNKLILNSYKKEDFLKIKHNFDISNEETDKFNEIVEKYMIEYKDIFS